MKKFSEKKNLNSIIISLITVLVPAAIAWFVFVTDCSWSTKAIAEDIKELEQKIDQKYERQTQEIKDQVTKMQHKQDEIYKLLMQWAVEGRLSAPQLITPKTSATNP